MSEPGRDLNFDELHTNWRVAKIRSVTEDGLLAYFDIENGLTGSVSRVDVPLELKPGDVIVVDIEAKQMQSASKSLWKLPEGESSAERVAVVLLRTDSETVLDENGRFRLLQTPTTPTYRVGNTVVTSADGILRVLSQRPLNQHRDSAPTEETIAGFKFAPSDTESVEWADFGGMRGVIEEISSILETMQSAQFKSVGARPVRGVLFKGPPGTGKTMLAKIIANRAEATFYRISGPEVVSKWFGETEAVLRAIFEDAARQPRSIIFFDEIDTLAGRRSELRHETSQHVVTQLLTLLDGFASKGNVLVLGATNRADAIDPAIRRPGRFDREIEFYLPDQHEREQILRASSRRVKLDQGLPLETIATQTENWSGAQLSAIWTESGRIACADGRELIMKEDLLEGFQRVLLQLRQKGEMA